MKNLTTNTNTNTNTDTDNKGAKGKIGENLASLFLIKNSYDILESNFYSRYGEIDIIAKKGDLIVFAEVKYRKNDYHSTPSMAVNTKKQEKIKKTALKYISDNNITNKDFRFDIIEIVGIGELKVNHIENAFC
ncbi:MAG: YraN family protein [Defluviitaleaceae bacterium]|nr:YraN family protein [Defluviitaleaceae bacterium]